MVDDRLSMAFEALPNSGLQPDQELQFEPDDGAGGWSSAQYALEHERSHQYAVAASLSRGRTVVDLGCGEGTGSHVLARQAKHVTGVDWADEVIERAQHRHRGRNLTFVRGDYSAIPVRDRTCDVVVAIGCLERIDDREVLLLEVRRVLRPGGLLLVATREKYANGAPLDRSANDDNDVFDSEELSELLLRHFRRVRIHGQIFAETSVLDGVTSGGVFRRKAGLDVIDVDDSGFGEEKLARPTHLVAVASNSALPDISASILMSSSQPLRLSDRFAHMAQVADAQRTAALRECEGLQQRVDRLQSDLNDLGASAEEAQQASAHLAKRLSTSEQEIVALRDELSGTQRALDKAALALTVSQSERERLEGRYKKALQRKEREYVQLQSDLDDMAHRHARAEMENVALRRKYGAALDSLKAADTAVSGLGSEITAAAREALRHQPLLTDRNVVPARYEQTALVAKSVLVQSLSPHNFDSEFYLGTSPDVGIAGVDPFEHFWSSGCLEDGRFPNLLYLYGKSSGELAHRRAAFERTAECGQIALLFDQEDYCTKYPDVAESGIDPFFHYCSVGWIDGRDPNCLFSTARYIATNPDVGTNSINPLLHFALFGGQERREIGGVFDTKYYIDANADVVESGMNPLQHFVHIGLAERRKPSANIDPASYLADSEFGLSAWPRVRLLMSRIDDTARGLSGIAFPEVAEPVISIIVTARDSARDVMHFLSTLAQNLPSVPMEVLVADLHSHDLLPLAARQWPGVRYFSNGACTRWSEIVNAAACAARGTYTVVCEGNIELKRGWESAILKTFERGANVGALGGKILNVSGSLQDGGRLLWNDGSLTILGHNSDSSHPDFTYLRPVDAVSPSFLATRTELLLRCRGFDHNYLSASYAVADFSMRLREQGLTVAYQASAEAVRFARAQAEIDSGDDRVRFAEQWPALPRSFPSYSVRHKERLRGHVGRVLVIDQLPPRPDRDAGSVTQVHTLDILLRLGWSVSFVPEATMESLPRYTAHLQEMGVHCVHRPQYQNLYDFVLEHGQSIDLLLLYRGPHAQHYLNVVAPHCPNAKVLLDTVDLHYLREQRQAELADSRELREVAASTKERELDAVRRSDCTVVLSQYEEEVLRAEIPDARISVLPLIMDVKGRLYGFQDLRDICFIGGFAHHPNADAVQYFVKEIWPIVSERLPDAKFRIMGSDVSAEIQALEGNGVVIDGYVPDLGTSLARCRVNVAPLRYGAGIKGKLGSSLSFGIPSVASSVATEGMGLGPLDGVEVADDPREFAERIIQLYVDEAHWMRMSSCGLAFVEREYSLAVNAERIADILRGMGLPHRDIGQVKRSFPLSAWDV